jgi:hypothetical protein
VVHAYTYVLGSIFLLVVTKHRNLQEVSASHYPGTDAELPPWFSVEAPTDGKKISAPYSCHEVNVTDDLHFTRSAVALKLD